MHRWHLYSEMVTALFVMADPIGAIPIFLSLTRDQMKDEKRHTAVLTAVTVGVVLVLMALAGAPLLGLFGIRIASFRVAGGILVLMMSISMVYTPPRPVISREAVEAVAKHELAVVPLGVPLIAGPGVISSVIVYAQQAKGWFDIGFLIGAIILVAASICVALLMAQRISTFLGRNGINVITRLLGLLLAAIAIEFITGGLAELLPGLASPAAGKKAYTPAAAAVGMDVMLYKKGAGPNLILFGGTVTSPVSISHQEFPDVRRPEFNGRSGNRARHDDVSPGCL